MQKYLLKRSFFSLLFMCALLLSSSSDVFAAGVTWTVRTAAGSRNWQAISSSSDGVKLAATAYGGYIYTSTDSGATWTEQTTSGQRSWYSISSSSDGVKLVAAVYNGYIYTSTDSGATWTEQTTSGQRSWHSISSSSDGVKLVAAVYNGYIYTSTDSGATWTEQTNAGSLGWDSITTSSDGVKLAATAYGGYIYTSTDSGATWTEQTTSGQRSWYSISSSSDGTKLAAVVSGGYIYTSTDSGATWTEQTNPGSRSWRSVASSVDGTKIAVVASNDYIFTAVPDVTPPTLSSFTSTNVDGTYLLGQTVGVTATFNETLSASSTMTIVLDTGASVVLDYVNGATLNGTSTVALGETSSDLTVASITSASVSDIALNNQTSYSVPASPNNIADASAIVVDAALPTLTSFTSTTTDGSYGIDNSINVTATFSEALGSGSTMTVLLNTGASVTLNNVSGSTLTGTYTITSSNTSTQDLTVSSITSASVNDVVLNNQTSYSVPASPNNIADTKAIAVNLGGTVSVAFLQSLNSVVPSGATICNDPQAYNYRASQSCTYNTTAPAKYLFTRNLSLGMQGEDVKELQKYLNIRGFVITQSGPGSVGNETTRFGSLTKAALIRFQEAHATEILLPSGFKKGTGYFGPSTRGWVNGR